jgi:hypothetical protein
VTKKKKFYNTDSWSHWRRGPSQSRSQALAGAVRQAGPVRPAGHVRQAGRVRQAEAERQAGPEKEAAGGGLSTSFMALAKNTEDEVGLDLFHKTFYFGNFG